MSPNAAGSAEANIFMDSKSSSAAHLFFLWSGICSLQLNAVVETGEMGGEGTCRVILTGSSIFPMAECRVTTVRWSREPAGESN